MFDDLLAWLSHDRESAAREYERIRTSLVRIFAMSREPDAEQLADEVINRVAIKLPELAREYKGNPALYFYGVAKKVRLEQRKAPTLAVSLDDPALDMRSIPEPPTSDIEKTYQQLDACLRRLSEQQRDLLLKYYTPRPDKVAYRKQLALQLGLTDFALRKQVHRLRVTLRACLKKRMRFDGT
jgi:DNA-directed RNA polymerase specialized sigma24 family protein